MSFDGIAAGSLEPVKRVLESQRRSGLVINTVDQHAEVIRGVLNLAHRGRILSHAEFFGRGHERVGNSACNRQRARGFMTERSRVQRRSHCESHGDHCGEGHR